MYLKSFLTSADWIVTASDTIYFLAFQTVASILARAVVPLTSPSVVILFALAFEKWVLFS